MPASAERPEVTAPGPGRYLLNLVRTAPRGVFVDVRASCDDVPMQAAIPVQSRTDYVLHISTGALTLSFDPVLVAKARLRPARWHDALTLARTRGAKRIRIPFGDHAVLSPLMGLPSADRGELRKALHLLADWGLTLDKPFMRGAGRWPVRAPEASPSPAEGTGLRICVALHLYYRDLWPEFAAAFRNIPEPFRLIVSVTEHDPAFEAAVRRQYPDADIRIYQNRGRDVGPFLQMLADDVFDGCDVVCKLHGKRSGADGPRALLGEVWRRLSVQELLGSPDRVRAILDRFAQSPDVGVIGPGPFRLPNDFIPLRHSWGTNQDRTYELMRALGAKPEEMALDFFAGTMFWIRRAALEPIRTLGLDLQSFRDEDAALDGGLEHAVERVFALAPVAAGYRLENAGEGGDLIG